MKKTIFIAMLLALMFASTGIANACVSGFYAKLPNSSAVYYVKMLEGGTKYVFPDANTFFTHTDSFKDVTKLTSEDQDIMGTKLSEAKNGGIMKYKANTKKLIKHVNSPRVYAVDKNQKLHWIKSEDTLLKLGYSFANINDLNEAFFISYEIGEPISQPVHLDKSIIKYQGDDKVFMIENGKKRKIVIINSNDKTHVPASEVLDKYKEIWFKIAPDIIYPDGEDYIINWPTPVPTC